MKARCLNKNDKSYKNYGGRGITVCPEWVNDFMIFYKDMGERLQGLTLDRIDNNGNYCKENCRWSSPKEQNNNTRRNRFITYNGKTQTIAQWADELGINYHMLICRMNRGWGAKRTLTESSNFGKYEKKVAQKKGKKIIKIFVSLSSAKKIGFNAGHICECCQNKRKTHKGFIWEYV